MASVDPAAFVSRLERLYSSWESEEDEDRYLWGGVDALAAVVGRDEVLYSKSTSLQNWMFGYELTDTLCVFCANELHILTSKKKADFLRPLEPALKKRSDLPDLRIHMRNKGDGDAQNFDSVLSAIKKSKKGKVVGVFMKDKFTGEFVDGWNDSLSALKQVDISNAFAYVSSSKDEAEIGLIKKACQVTCTVFSKYVKKEIVTIVDEEKKVKHSTLADNIDHAVTEDSKLIPPGIDSDQIEMCYSPIIQSGGNYQLKFSTVSSDERLHFGTIICCLGIRYKSYCSNIVRTMFVEPTQEMQDNYSFLLSVYAKVLESLKDGVRLCDVYSSALQHVEAEHPELKDHFTRNIGFVTGIEFRESSLLISPKTTLAARKGMVFNVNLGFAGLTSPGSSGGGKSGKPYALFVGDTVLVEGEDQPALELTAVSKKKLSSIAIFLGDAEDENNQPPISGYVEQDSLVLSTTKGNPRLRDLYMRPVLGSRRVQGTLEAHTNGVRYTTLKGDRVDVLYNNIKHAFFQPSKGEQIVLLHFNLKHPILAGKKKNRDIQFYTEVGEIMTDLGRSQHMHDRDDLMAEQAERELRSKLDTAFDMFRKKIESLTQCHAEFEKPFRELSFHGVPFRSTVLLQPTTNCLVNLTDQPPFIITLDEVELVHFERVQFHMRNFDMVFVFKDYKKKVAMISSIPMTSLDSIKEWFNSCDIKYTEGIQSLNWTKILKTINDDPEDFFNSGGWSFLDPNPEGESDDDENGSSESDEYNPSDVEEEGDDISGDSDEDYTSLSEQSSESDYDEDSEEESGKDWDELEEEAKQADKERVEYEEDNTDSRMKRKRPLPSQGANRSSGSSSNKKPKKTSR